MSFFQLLAILISFALHVVSSDNKNYFISPASNDGINPVLTLGETTVISWKTTLDVFNVTIWQQSLVEQGASSQGNIYSKIHAADQVSNFTWAVQLYDFDFDYSNVFFLWINPDGPGGFISAFFNITQADDDASPTTHSSNSTSTPSPNPSPSNASSAASSTASSKASEQADESGARSTTTEKVAIGVGCGVGIPILCALGVLIWLKARQKKPQPAAPPVQVAAQPWSNAYYQSYPPGSPKEVHATSRSNFHAELPTQGFR